MKNTISFPLLKSLSIIVLLGSLTTQCKQKSPEKPKPVNETDIVIPEGFSLQVVAEDLGNLRHMTVSKNGDIYVNRSKLKDEN